MLDINGQLWIVQLQVHHQQDMMRDFGIGWKKLSDTTGKYTGTTTATITFMHCRRFLCGI